MPFADRPGVSIYYQELGDPAAPPVLLVMGMGFSSRAWDQLPHRLAERFRVIVFDNRGTGRSRPAGRENGGAANSARPHGRLFNMRILADDAASVLESAGVPTRDSASGGALVFGVSMGGMIAQELALRHPARVRRLALGATFADYFRSDKPRLETVLALSIATTFPGREQVARIGRVLVSDPFLRQHEERFARWLRTTEFGGTRLAVAQMAAIMRHSTITRLPTIDIPTLVMTGDADRLVPHSNSLRIHSLVPGARLEILPGVGHVFPFEQEDETTAILTEHFRV